MLARSSESRIYRVNELDKFGALIIDTYDYGNEDAAFERLNRFAQDHALICLSADNPLFQRIQKARADFPLLELIDRQPEEPGETVEALKPSYHYNSSSIRQQWKKIRSLLERNKIQMNLVPSDAGGRIEGTRITLNADSGYQLSPVPILVANTFHPNWRSPDDNPVYAVTPFFMLAFVNKPTVMDFRRGTLEMLGVFISFTTVIGLSGLLLVAELRYRRTLAAESARIFPAEMIPLWNDSGINSILLA